MFLDRFENWIGSAELLRTLFDIFVSSGTVCEKKSKN